MKIEIPKNCPCCSYPLVLVNEQLFCKNSACSAQLNKKLEHFSKTLGIKGFGPKTIEKLNLQDIVEIFYLDREQVVLALGSEKVADKLLTEIEQAKSADLATVIASFSIPLVGQTAAGKICKVISTVDDINPETCRKAGLGEKVTANLVNWVQHDLPEMRQFLPFSFTSDNNNNNTVVANGPTICITGKLSSYKTKAEAYKLLEESGFRVVESVTKTLEFLVDEENKGSTKRTKAESLGVTIIPDLKTFLKEII